MIIYEQLQVASSLLVNDYYCYCLEVIAGWCCAVRLSGAIGLGVLTSMKGFV